MCTSTIQNTLDIFGGQVQLYYIYDKFGKYCIASNNNTAETDTYIPCDV